MPDSPTARALARSRSMACTTSVWERLADSGGMAADQVALERGRLLGGDADVGQVAEAGRHPVHRLARRHHLLDHAQQPPSAPAPHPRPRPADRPAPPTRHRRWSGHGRSAGAGLGCHPFLYYGRAEVPGPDEPPRHEPRRAVPARRRGPQPRGRVPRRPHPAAIPVLAGGPEADDDLPRPRGVADGERRHPVPGLDGGQPAAGGCAITAISALGSGWFVGLGFAVCGLFALAKGRRDSRSCSPSARWPSRWNGR